MKFNAQTYNSPLLQASIDEVFKEKSPALKRCHSSDNEEEGPTKANKQLVVGHSDDNGTPQEAETHPNTVQNDVDMVQV